MTFRRGQEKDRASVAGRCLTWDRVAHTSEPFRIHTSEPFRMVFKGNGARWGKGSEERETEIKRNYGSTGCQVEG